MPTNISVTACTGSHAALSRTLALACSEASVCPRMPGRSSSWMSAHRQVSAKKVLKVSSRAPGAMAEQSLTATAGSQSWCFLARRHRDKVQLEGVCRQPINLQCRDLATTLTSTLPTRTHSTELTTYPHQTSVPVQVLQQSSTVFAT
jgi:hypothetical protein